MPDSIPGQIPENEIGKPIEEQLEYSEVKGSEFAEKSFADLNESIQDTDFFTSEQAIKEQIEVILKLSQEFTNNENIGQDDRDIQLKNQKFDEFMDSINQLAQTIFQIKRKVVLALPKVDGLVGEDLELTRQLHHHVKNLISGRTIKLEKMDFIKRTDCKNELGHFLQERVKSFKPYAQFYKEFAELESTKGLDPSEIELKIKNLIEPEALTELGLSFSDLEREIERMHFKIASRLTREYATAYYDFSLCIHEIKFILAHKADIIANKGKIEYMYYSDQIDYAYLDAGNTEKPEDPLVPVKKMFQTLKEAGLVE